MLVDAANMYTHISEATHYFFFLRKTKHCAEEEHKFSFHGFMVKECVWWPADMCLPNTLHCTLCMWQINDHCLRTEECFCKQYNRQCAHLMKKYRYTCVRLQKVIPSNLILNESGAGRTTHFTVHCTTYICACEVNKLYLSRNPVIQESTQCCLNIMDVKMSLSLIKCRVLFNAGLLQTCCTHWVDNLMLTIAASSAVYLCVCLEGFVGLSHGLSNLSHKEEANCPLHKAWGSYSTTEERTALKTFWESLKASAGRRSPDELMLDNQQWVTFVV